MTAAHGADLSFSLLPPPGADIGKTFGGDLSARAVAEIELPPSTQRLLTMKSNIIAMFLLIAALAPQSAVAGIAEPRDSAQGGGVELDSDQTVFRQLTELSREAKFSLSEAIAMAEKLHNGSRAVQIGFERAGCPEYRVRTVRDSVIWENTIDARNGSMTGKETVSSLSELSSDDRRDVDALKHVSPELSEAVLFAENAVAGKAVGASLVDEDGTANFAVVVISNDRLKQVMLEARRIDRHVTTSHRAARSGHHKPGDFEPQ